MIFKSINCRRLCYAENEVGDGGSSHNASREKTMYGVGGLKQRGRTIDRSGLGFVVSFLFLESLHFLFLRVFLEL